MSKLLTFRQVTRESFGEAMEVAVNLSKVFKTDLQSAVLQLGKALEDPVTGLTALNRSGVSFNEAQEAVIKKLVETGRHAEAITLILRTMKDQGLDQVAKSMNQGLFKATNDVKLEWGDMLKALGQSESVLSITNAALTQTRWTLEAIKKLAADDGVRGALGGPAVGNIGGAKPPISPRDFGGETEQDYRIRQINAQIADAKKQGRAKPDQRGAGESMIMGLQNQLDGLDPHVTLVDKVIRQLTETTNQYTLAEKAAALAIAGEIDMKKGQKEATDAYLQTTQFDTKVGAEIDDLKLGAQQRFEQIKLENESEMELLNKKLADKQLAIEKALAWGLISEGQAAEQRELLEQQHQATMFEIERRKNEAVRNMQLGTWQLGAELLQQFAGKSKAAALAVIAINKGLAIAQVIQNTQVAIMRGYAELGPYGGSVNAAAMKTLEAIQIGLIAATGLAQGMNVGGAGASLGSPANPINTTGGFGSGSPTFVDTSNRSSSQTVVNVNVYGPLVGSDGMRELTEQHIAPAIRDLVGQNDLIIIPQNSRQASDLTT
jgi:hypothetical protein